MNELRQSHNKTQMDAAPFMDEHKKWFLKMKSTPVEDAWRLLK